MKTSKGAPCDWEHDQEFFRRPLDHEPAPPKTPGIFRTKKEALLKISLWFAVGTVAVVLAWWFIRSLAERPPEAVLAGMGFGFFCYEFFYQARTSDDRATKALLTLAAVLCLGMVSVAWGVI